MKSEASAEPLVPAGVAGDGARASERPAAVRPAVRPANDGDVGRIDELYQMSKNEIAGQRGGAVLLGLLGRAEPTSFMSLSAEPGRCLFVGPADGSPLQGYAAGRTLRMEGDGPLGQALVGWVQGLFVEPGARRNRLGTALCAQMVDWFADQGCVGIDGLALPGNRAVKSFFESQSFTARLLVMHRRLS